MNGTTGLDMMTRPFFTVRPFRIKRISRRIDLHFMSAQDQTRPWIDAGYYLLFPMACIFVLWFRRGWTLTWAVAWIMVTLCAGPRPAQASGGDFPEAWGQFSPFNLF